MNILIVSDYLFPGGIATYVVSLCRYLQKGGVAPYIIASECSMDIEHELQALRLPYEKVTARYTNFLRWAAITYIKIFFLSLRLLRRSEFHWVILNTPVSAVAFLHAATLLRKRLKISYQFHGALDLEFQHGDRFWDEYYQRTMDVTHAVRSLYRMVKYAVARHLQRYAFTHVNTVLTFSSYGASLLTSHFGLSPQKIIRVHPGVPALDSQRSSKHKDAGAPLFRPNRHLLLFISRLEPRKGIFVFLDVMKHLRTLRRDFLAIVYADYRLRTPFTEVFIEYVQHLPQGSNVLLIQHTNDGTKQFLLSQASVVIVPSQDLETFGFVTLEAFRSGVPVCAFGIGANRETVVAPKYLLVTTVSSWAMAKKIHRFLSLPRDKRVMVVKHIRRRVRDYNWKDYVRVLLKN